MEVVLEMTLPRNAESAPLVRHTLDASLRGLGVGSEIRADIVVEGANLPTTPAARPAPRPPRRSPAAARRG